MLNAINGSQSQQPFRAAPSGNFCANLFSFLFSSRTNASVSRQSSILIGASQNTGDQISDGLRDSGLLDLPEGNIYGQPEGGPAAAPNTEPSNGQASVSGKTVNTTNQQVAASASSEAGSTRSSRSNSYASATQDQTEETQAIGVKFIKPQTVSGIGSFTVNVVEQCTTAEVKAKASKHQDKAADETETTKPPRTQTVQGNVLGDEPSTPKAGLFLPTAQDRLDASVATNERREKATHEEVDLSNTILAQLYEAASSSTQASPAEPTVHTAEVIAKAPEQVRRTAETIIELAQDVKLNGRKDGSTGNENDLEVTLRTKKSYNLDGFNNLGKMEWNKSQNNVYQKNNTFIVERNDAFYVEIKDLQQ